MLVRWSFWSGLGQIFQVVSVGSGLSARSDFPLCYAVFGMFCVSAVSAFSGLSCLGG